MIKRAFRHLFTLQSAGRRAFPHKTLKAIQAAIAKGESLHRAEVRLVIEPSLEFFDALSGKTARQRARELFVEHHVWDTEENSGVLVYINLADRKVEIIADRGVARLVEAQHWEHACRAITSGFAAGQYHEGVVEGMDRLAAILHACLPGREGSNPNELSNRPLLL